MALDIGASSMATQVVDTSVKAAEAVEVSSSAAESTKATPADSVEISTEAILANDASSEALAGDTATILDSAETVTSEDSISAGNTDTLGTATLFDGAKLAGSVAKQKYQAIDTNGDTVIDNTEAKSTSVALKVVADQKKAEFDALQPGEPGYIDASRAEIRSGAEAHGAVILDIHTKNKTVTARPDMIDHYLERADLNHDQELTFDEILQTKSQMVKAKYASSTPRDQISYLDGGDAIYSYLTGLVAGYNSIDLTK
ncbi:MAG: hypothetical protein AB7P76_10205 [Candidatus Melainabacteria bacterium]